MMHLVTANSSCPKTFRFAAEAFLSRHRNLLEWIRDELWLNPRGGAKKSKADLIAMMEALDNSQVHHLQPDVAKDYLEALRGARVDLQGSVLPRPGFLTDARPVADHIVDLINAFQSELMNQQFTMVTPSIKTPSVIRSVEELKGNARAFKIQFQPLLNDVDTALGTLKLDFLRVSLQDMRTAIKILDGTEANALTEHSATALLRGALVLKEIHQVFSYCRVSNPNSTVVTQLLTDRVKQAADEYDKNLTGLMMQLEQKHGGLAKHFSSQRAGRAAAP